jgi:hypothetical protein
MNTSLRNHFKERDKLPSLEPSSEKLKVSAPKLKPTYSVKREASKDFDNY